MRRLAALTAAATLVGVLAMAPVGEANAVSPTLPPADMVSWWPGENNADDIEDGNDGAEIGGLSFVAGQVGDAFTISGSGADFVRVPDATNLEPANVTVDAWVRADGSPGNFRYVVAKGANVCSVASYAIYTGSGGGLRFYISNGVAVFVLSPAVAPGAIWDNSWHHVAGTFDGAVVRFYVDGVEIGGGTATGLAIGYATATTGDLLIGQYGGTCSLPFNGDIDEVEVFSRALSQAEIQAIFDAGVEGKVKEIVGDTDNEEIDISSVQVSDDGTDLSCMLFIATDSGLKDKSTFRCHFDFDDVESEALARQGAGCDANNDSDTEDTYQLGSNQTGIGPYCTTSDITLTYRPTRRGGFCTGLPSVSCEELEFDSSGAFQDFDCDGDAGPDSFCKINITASLADLDAAWESECRTDDDCLTSATDKDTNDEYDVFMFFDSQYKGDRDRVPDTDPGTTKPDEEGEVVVETFPVPAP